jgi:hypothetical protein
VKSLKDDTRGAVMFIGVFFACFLIGILWFMIGIGDAIVFRERAQEAADASTFASAVIHAKGMNMIAFINVVLLALVGVYLIMCIVVDALLALATALAGTWFFSWAAIPLFKSAKVVDTYASVYKAGMKPLVFGVTTVQTGTAYLAPWVGAAAGLKAGQEYGMTSIVLSPSMIPGAGAGKVLDTVSSYLKKEGSAPPKPPSDPTLSSAATAKIGLPVKQQKLQETCRVVIGFIGDQIRNVIRDKVGGIIAEFVGSAIGSVSKYLGNTAVSLHCAVGGSPQPPDIRVSDGTVKSWFYSILSSYFTVYEASDLWGDKYGGPKEMYKPAKNGSDWMQVYSLTIATATDSSMRNVERASYVFGGKDSAENHMYTAQAEFYYNCKGKWSDYDCNFKGSYDHAIYDMRWRARLVRHRGFSATTLGIDFVGTLLASDATAKFIREKAGPKLDAALAKAGLPADKWLGKVMRDVLVGGGAEGKKDAINGVLKKGADKLGGALAPTPMPKGYH